MYAATASYIQCGVYCLMSINACWCVELYISVAPLCEKLKATAGQTDKTVWQVYGYDYIDFVPTILQ